MAELDASPFLAVGCRNRACAVRNPDAVCSGSLSEVTDFFLSASGNYAFSALSGVDGVKREDVRDINSCMCGTDFESMTFFTVNWLFSTVSVFPLFTVSCGFLFKIFNSFNTSCKYEAGTSVFEADGLIKHGEWSFLAITSSEH